MIKKQICRFIFDVDLSICLCRPESNLCPNLRNNLRPNLPSSFRPPAHPKQVVPKSQGKLCPKETCAQTSQATSAKTPQSHFYPNSQTWDKNFANSTAHDRNCQNREAQPDFVPPTGASEFWVVNGHVGYL